LAILNAISRALSLLLPTAKQGNALMIAQFASSGETQPFSDLGHALYAKGYTRTVWVNSFDRRLAYLAWQRI